MAQTVVKKRYKKKQAANQSQESSFSQINLSNSSKVSLNTLSRASTSRISMETLDLTEFVEPNPIKKLKFPYNFNEYLRFFLLKKLPPRSKTIKINSQQNTIEGPQQQCEAFIKQLKNELDRYAMKVIKHQKNIDIEFIEFQIENKYDKNFKLFKKKFLQLTVLDLIKKYNFTKQGENFLSRLQKQQIFLIRIKKENCQNCLEDIENLLNPKKQESSQDQIIQEEHEPSFYQHSQVVKHNVMEEPTQSDSVSVVQQKRYKKNRISKWQKPQLSQRERRKVQQSSKIIKKNIIQRYEYQSFDQNDFQKWLKNNKILSKDNINIIKKIDPYADQDLYTYSIELLSLQGNIQNQLKQNLDIYLKFRKVLFLQLKNQKYKDQLISQYQFEDMSLSIKYIQGYKSPKWPEHLMWKHLQNKSYSQNKKSANTEYFELFYIVGLKNLVTQKYDQLKDKIKNQPLNDKHDQMIIKMKEIQDHIRNNNKLKQAIKQSINKIMTSFEKHCKLTSIQFPSNAIKLNIKIKFQDQTQYQNSVRNNINERIINDIKLREFKSQNPIQRYVYQKLQKNVIIIQRHENNFKYFTPTQKMQKQLNEIHTILANQNKINQIQFDIKDKIIANKCEQFLKQKTKQKKYSEIRFNYISQKQKLKIFGKSYSINSLKKQITQLIQQIQSKKIQYYQFIKRKQGQYLQSQNIIKKIQQKYNINIKINKIDLPCKIILNKNNQSLIKKKIIIIKSKTLDNVPYGSVFLFRNMQEIELFSNNFLKKFKNYIKHNKDEIFHQNTRKYTLLIKSNKNLEDSLKDSLAVHPNIANHIILIMPLNGKQDFVKSIIKYLNQNKTFQQRQMTIMIVQYGLSTDIYQSINIPQYIKGKKLKLKDQIITKYYIQDGKNKFYYSESGNKKILTAKQKGFYQVILNNQDLDISHTSHSFNPNTKQILHLQSSKSFPIKILNNKMQFDIQNQTYEIPPVQYAKILNCINKNLASVNISLGVYQIDISKMIQTNLFSGYERKLCSQQIIKKAELNQQQIQAYYNHKICQIQYSYTTDENIINNFDKCRIQINQILKKKIKQKQISFKDYKNIDAADIQEIIKSTIADDQQTQIVYDFSQKIIKFKTIDQLTFHKSEQFITKLLPRLNDKASNRLIYPKYWQQNQRQDIQTFLVDNKTFQFQEVQKMFSQATIKQLHRIQNKIIYKKYYDQSIFLEQINGAPVKKMRLFHGTRTLNPQQIYKDKQQSFNINYSSDNNLLGKGIYFAQKSQYSNDYRHTEVNSTGGIFGLAKDQVYSMFLCQVLVGQSEKCQKHNNSIKDTTYKDPIKKIKYESMTDFLNNSNIYVVYKSRRAYPLYLIKYK